MKKAKILRNIADYFAYTIMTAMTAMVLFMVIGEGLSDLDSTWAWESVAILILTALSLISTIVVWLKKKFGYFMLILTGLAWAFMVLMTAQRNYWQVALLLSAPYVVSGALFILINRKDLKFQKK